jgi:hypothetical protein
MFFNNFLTIKKNCQKSLIGGLLLEGGAWKVMEKIFLGPVL